MWIARLPRLPEYWQLSCEPRPGGSRHYQAGLAFVVALLRNSRKTECGAGQFLKCLAVRAAPFALPAGRGSVLQRWTQ
jgi:hypothetical protein